ncbi:methyltransferase domain-containing protein [Paenibacillus sp. IB182496]|uniref:Methyltransferase domain-containing protein n=1 Tax=Paenibacillus sabuli TaxID=2772509 RepID=A0A927GU17_9BACL|nr:class I SAM-dependent methyltransferase [Paenibacillus sabuli]MBD2847680.1 methyltransferase domain-containing protein [Paenibacillus sabuli]
MSMSYRTDTDNFLHDNPALYDAFGGDKLSMARFVHTLLTQYNIGGRVLDIGCGLGREAAYLHEAGYEAVGLDNSEAMLAWARKHSPGPEYVYGSQADFRIADDRAKIRSGSSSLEPGEPSGGASRPEAGATRLFDAVYCVGSTFLYNYSNGQVEAALGCFRRHLAAGGLLYLDMRNAAFFLTEEGRRWLTEELTDECRSGETLVRMRTRFAIDPKRQLLERDYTWQVGDDEPIREHLQHRLLFPQELAYHVERSGFRIMALFDTPAPHIERYDPQARITFGSAMTGRRMQLVAEAI